MRRRFVIITNVTVKPRINEPPYFGVRLAKVLKLWSFIVRTLREDQPLRLLLNLLFYHFNRSEPTYKSQRIKLLDVIAACNQLNVNALN